MYTPADDDQSTVWVELVYSSHANMRVTVCGCWFPQVEREETMTQLMSMGALSDSEAAQKCAAPVFASLQAGLTAIDLDSYEDTPDFEDADPPEACCDLSGRPCRLAAAVCG
jgi:hypothetical protein